MLTAVTAPSGFPARNVPIHESILQEVKDKLFGSPFRKGKLHVYPLELVIAVQNGQPLVDPRNLQRVSPGLSA